MRSKEFDIDHDQGNQHTESSIEGSMENSILVAKPQLAIKHRKNHMTGKQPENQCLISHIRSRPKHASNQGSLMIPLLGKVVENKIFVPTKQDPKIIQERSHTRFRPLLTNGCSGRRVGEVGGHSGSSRSRSPTNSPSIYPTNKSLEQVSEKKKMLLEEGSKL